jgi:hypothetical protein
MKHIILMVCLVLVANAQVMVHTPPEYSHVKVTRVPNGEATSLLESLIPSDDKHHMATISVYTPGGMTDRRDLGAHCSGSSSNDQDGNGSSFNWGCRELHRDVNEVWLGLEDASHPGGAYLITARCVVEWRWNHCEVPPPGSFYNVVLQKEKHGNFNIYIGVHPNIGEKVKVSTWNVLYLEHVVPTEEKK